MLLPLLLNLDHGAGNLTGRKSVYKSKIKEKVERKREDLEREDNEFLIEFLKTATDIINNQ